MSADVEIRPPAPLDPIGERFWIPKFTMVTHAAWHGMNAHGALKYRLRHARKGFEWQRWPAGDLPDEIGPQQPGGGPARDDELTAHAPTGRNPGRVSTWWRRIPEQSRSAAFGRAADPRRRGGWCPLARDRPRHRAAARARVAHRRARGPPRRARRSVRAGARGHLLRRAPPRLRVHVERARGDAAVRRRHRAPSRLLPHRPDQPRGGPCVLQGLRRGRPQPGGPRQADRGRHRQRRPQGPRRVRDDVRGGAAVRRVARPRRGHPGGARVRLRALGRTGIPGHRRRRDPVADASPARGEGHLPLPLRRGPRRGTRRHRASNGRRVRPAARRARRAELRRHPRRAGRDADVGAGARERAVSADLDRGRADRRRIRGHRRDHRSQVAVAARALDGCGRARRGRRLAHGPAGRLRHARAARRARARPRPGRRVERDLGEAGTARVRGVGARAPAPSLHRAGLRPVAGARSDRAPGRLTPRAARRLRLPPRHARAGARSGRPHPRRRRLLRGHARGAAVQAGARCAGGRGGVDARGRRGTARPGSCRRGARCRRPPRAGATSRAARRADRARARSPPRARARRVQPGRSPTDLGISAKTVGHHVQHVYQKAGVRSRAAATLWAFEHDLVHAA